MRFDDIQAFDDGGMVDNSSPMQFDDIQPEEAPNAPAQFADIQASGQPQPAQAGPEPPQTGPIGAAIAGAAPAAAPITAAIAAGARTMAAIPNPWIGVPAGLVAGLIASGVVGKIQDWLRDQYGPSTGPLSKPYEAAAEQQQPLAYNIGRVAPIAAGMTTGNVTPLVRAASAGLMGGVDVLQQGIEKGFSNINPTEALIQAGAGAIMPQAREWAGGPRTSAGTGETPVGKPATQDALAEQQIQGTKSAPFNISNAEGTSATQSPPTNSRRAPVAEATVEDQGTGFSMVASSRDELKPGVGPGRPGEGVEGAPSTVVDTAPIPADVAAATAQAPAETPAPAQAQSTPPAPAPQPPPNPASALPRGPQPVPQAAELAPQSQLGQPSTTPIPGALNPDEGLLQASRAQREAIANIKAKNAQQQTGEAFKPEEDTSTGLEGQVPNAQKVINDAMVAALQRPIVRQPMPSIANSSKDITGPVVIDPTVPPEFDKPLAVHETVEGELEKLGMKYPQSHQIATMAEKTAAEHAGMDWGQYTKWFAQNSAQIEAQKIMPDTWDHLDLASDPYTDIGHHTNKEIAEDTEQALKSPDLSTPEAARPPSDFTGKLDPNISASDYTQRLAALRADRPRPINKLWNNPDTAPPDRVAAQQAKIKAWNSEYATVSRNQKQALDRDNANFYAKQAVGQEQVSTPGAEIAPPSGNVPDLNEIPDFLRRQPPAAQEAIAKSIGTEPTIEGTPHS